MDDDLLPLCVDLDGTLATVDTLHESLLDLCRRSPASLAALPAWLLRGKAAFKAAVAARAQLDVEHLPLNEPLLEWLRGERARGRKLVLATAAHASIADALAQRLGLFDEVLASDGATNLSSERKRAALVARFGERGFDYAGNGSADLAVWRSARQAIVVGGAGLAARAARLAPVARRFDPPAAGLRTWARALRLHQWVKNVLVFVPALVAHRIAEPAMMLASARAFLAFGLCASSVYVVNDLLDLTSDRRHPRKRARPFAAGRLQARGGLVAAALLVAGTVLAALGSTPWFALSLAGYYVLTWAYSLRLKRAALVDVMTLAGLYTLRIVAGAAATLIYPSFWLLAFSIFMFLCLGIVKRYAELYDAHRDGKAGGHGRGYSGHDLGLLLAMGVASGFSAIIVLALYINTPGAQSLYRHSEPMWLICPLLLYWLSRMWLLATRGQMDDDPVVFAVRDRISLATLALAGLLAWLSA